MYDIKLGDDVLGEAHVSLQGLYYHIKCRCTLTGDIMYRVTASCGDRHADLGLCVPMGGQFGLEKRIPVKLLGEGGLSFRLSPNHKKPKGRFVPIRADEPFVYLEYMENAYLARSNGQIGAVIHAQLSEDTLPESS